MSIKSSITIDEVIELLNEVVKLDQLAITDLVNSRVPCNLALADHPTIQVGKLESFSDPDRKWRVGLLGLLNGFFGIAEDGYGTIAANFELICPQGHPTEKEQSIKDKCKECGNPLELGKIIGFTKIRE